MNRTIWVCSLPDEIQQQIVKDITRYFIDNHDEMTVLEVADHVRIAMDGRLSDLDSTIVIGDYMDRLQVLERDLRD